MSGKLGQSLDEILKDNKSSGRRGGRPRRAVAKPTKTVAPAGGIKKNTRPARNVAKQAPTKAAKPSKESTIEMSNLPKDVTWDQIKKYFTDLKDTIGPVKLVSIQYINGVSSGSCHVTFARHDSGAKAIDLLKGLRLDNRPISAKLISGSPAAPALTERISKAQPKSAAKVKSSGKEAKPAAGAKATGKQGGRAARPKNARPAKKTAEELDAEMADYFDAAKATEATGAQTNNGDAQMEDEIM